jgi:hypothetical protein
MITPRLALRGCLAVIVLLVLLTGLALAQAPKAAPKATGTANKWTPPHTPWGDPDLQGIWNNSTITPIERPKELGEKQFLTDDQAAGLEERAAQSRVDSPPPKGDPGTYNQFWFERGTKVVPTKRTSLIVDTPDGRVPPLTAEGQKRDQERFRRLGPEALGSSGNGPFDSWEDISVVTRCITRGLPNAMIPGAYNNNLQIVQSPGFVALSSELMHETRIIPLNGRSHIDAGMHQWMGDSRGHWEGDTLVVDVTNFRDDDVTGFGVPYRFSETSHLHLVERFTRVNADTIDYEVTVDDPATFTRPWTASIPMVKSEGPIFEYACHEANYSMVDILKASRAQDNAPKDGSK